MTQVYDPTTNKVAPGVFPITPSVSLHRRYRPVS